MKPAKPQILLRIPSNHNGEPAMELIKKWPDGQFSIEMQVGEGIKNHNSTVPVAFFPLSQEQVNELISEYGEPHE